MWTEVEVAVKCAQAREGGEFVHTEERAPDHVYNFVAASAVPSFERDDTPFQGSAIKADALGWIFFRPL